MANGRGSVYLRAGQWTIGFTVNGRRVREKIGGNKRFAEMVLKKRMTEALENRYFSKRNFGRMPFREFAESYLDRVVPQMKSARSERIRVLSRPRADILEAAGRGSSPRGTCLEEVPPAARHQPRAGCGACHETRGVR